jgi:hypothetical protein
MLEKAKLQQTNLCLIDPLENASRWGIPIWPLERVCILESISLRNILIFFSLSS